MPRSMAHPDYQRTYWTPERRKAASEAAKERWRKKRAEQEAERQKKIASPIGKADEEIRQLYRRQEELANEWRRTKARREKLIEARTEMASAFGKLKELGLEQWLTWLND